MNTNPPRFRLKHLLIAVSLLAVAMWGLLQVQQEIRRARTIEQHKKSPLGSIAEVVEDGDLVLLRSGQAYGAIKILRQIAPPDWQRRRSGTIDYQWWYREDGSVRVFENVPQVKTGKVTGANEIRFGPFEPDWAASVFMSPRPKGVDGFGFIAARKSTRLRVVRTHPLLKVIDAASDEYEFGKL